MRLDDLVPTLLRSDPARPRITCYDDARGERISCPARCWRTGSRRRPTCSRKSMTPPPAPSCGLTCRRTGAPSIGPSPPGSVGESVTVTGDADVAVSTDPASLGDGPGILLTLAALARCASIPVPGDAIDEAKELATYADRFEAWERATDDASALQAGEGHGIPARCTGRRSWTAGAHRHHRPRRLPAHRHCRLRHGLARWSSASTPIRKPCPPDSPPRVWTTPADPRQPELGPRTTGSPAQRRCHVGEPPVPSDQDVQRGQPHDLWFPPNRGGFGAMPSVPDGGRGVLVVDGAHHAC